MTSHPVARKVEPGGMAIAPDLTASERAVVYCWLSGLLAREPSVETLRVYQSKDGRDLLEGLGEIAPLVTIVDEIRARVSNSTEAELAKIGLDLAGEYARLFLGVGGRRTAPPYQSFYVSENGRLMQHSAAAMDRELQRMDRRIASGFPEPPDHIAVQLAAIAEMTATADAAEQVDYINQNLLGWIGEFRDRCQAANASEFYSLAVCALVDFVQLDEAAMRHVAPLNGRI